METLTAICLGLGLAAACGLRVFLPLAIMSIGAKAGLFTPATGFEWVATWPAVFALSTACALEVIAYSVHWIDHALDTIATPAAIVAGALAVATQLCATDSAGLSPLITWATSIIVGGGAAAFVQTATVGVRSASTITTAGIANPIISWIQTAIAAVLSIVAVVLPILAAICILGVAILAVQLVLRWRRSRSALAVPA